MAFVLLCDMQKLEQKFLFRILILALTASFFQPAFAYNRQDIAIDSFCDLNQMNPGSIQHSKHKRCIGASGFHCATAPGCSSSANGFSMLSGQADFEPLRLTYKASHTRNNPALFTIYLNQPQHPPNAHTL